MMMDPSKQSLARWVNEGGTVDPQAYPASSRQKRDAELMLLRGRTIAIENTLIALLAGASAGQRSAVRTMAVTIRAQAGVAPHPLTESAALQMNHLVDRAEHFAGSG